MPNNITYDKSQIREIGHADPAFDELSSTLTESELHLREEVLGILLHNFGNRPVPASKLYECANEWISKGHVTTSGLVSYYKAYYNNR